eukprot:2332427-Amphidinium_carterae.2
MRRVVPKRVTTYCTKRRSTATDGKQAPYVQSHSHQDISEQAAALKLMKDVTSALSWLSIGRLECMLVRIRSWLSVGFVWLLGIFLGRYTHQRLLCPSKLGCCTHPSRAAVPTQVAVPAQTGTVLNMNCV